MQLITEKTKIALPIGLIVTFLGGGTWMTSSHLSDRAVARTLGDLQSKVLEIQVKQTELQDAQAGSAVENMRELKSLQKQTYELVLNIEKRLSKLEGKLSL
ncbi:MAG: hypothetical protein CMB99_16000 [Flavobacteriaceae bacterium]|jgi:hypothetical protein|nr:hypothetical protein [Flavobacteriaceae bacterium]|tara:strand:+ start:20031 stop:20333 length:303 start_codon:yes stop_codon:yes gene_type:complete